MPNDAPIKAAALAAAWGFALTPAGHYRGICVVHAGASGKPNATITAMPNGDVKGLRCWGSGQCQSRDLWARARRDVQGDVQGVQPRPRQSNNQQAIKRGVCRICRTAQELDEWLQCLSAAACDMRFRASPAGMALAQELMAARKAG